MQSTQQQPKFTEKTLRDAYFVLFRNKNKIMLCFAAVVLTVAIGTFFSPRIYQSDAKLMLRLGRESVSLDPTATIGQIAHIGQNRETEINSELEILNSRELAEKVVDAIGVENIIYGLQEESTAGTASPLLSKLRNAIKGLIRVPLIALVNLVESWSEPDPLGQLKQRELAINLLMKHLYTEAVKKRNIIYISYESQSPKLAQEVLQKLIDNYLDEHIRAYRTTGSYKFFDQQTEQLRTDLAATESRLKDLKNETGTASIEDQRRILLERIGDLQRELETAKSAAAASVAKIETFQKTLAVVPQKLMTEEVTGSANSAVDELRKRINDLQLKENELLSTFTETSVPVTEIRRQIKEARSLLRNTQQTREVTQGVNLTYQQIESDLLKEQGNLSSLRAKAETLQDQLADSQVELKNINEAEIQLAQLQRDVETQQVNYRKYSESLEQARIDQALEMEKISNISVVQFASFPVQPIRPRIMLNLVLGFFLGIFGGFGLAFLTEYLDRSFAKPEDIEEKLGLPVIASLPIMNPDLRMGIADLSPATVPQIHRGGLPAALNLDELEVYESCLELVSQSDSFATEPQPGAAHVIAITSCRQGEGVSTVAAQLSITLARRNTGRILLVDANFGHPTLSQIFGMETNSGLADILVGGNGNTAPNRPSFCDGLDILCSGHKDCDLSSPKASQAFTNLLHLWKREYNFVVIDSPPFDQQGAAIITGDLADSVLLVIEAEGVRWEVAQRALKRLKKAKSNVIGAILNKRRYYIPDWLYRRL